MSICRPILRIQPASEDRRYACWFALGLVAIGLKGILLLRGDCSLFWVGLLGLGIGVLFSLTLLLPLDLAIDASHAQFVVPFVQGLGYMMATAVPYALGFLRQASSGFEVDLEVLLAITFGMALLTTLFSPGHLRRSAHAGSGNLKKSTTINMRRGYRC